MVHINSLDITPPLLNASCAWSSDLTQLKALYGSPYTGAITTRTATLKGYKENESHTFAFANATVSSVNSYGYSPHPFAKYLAWIEELLTTAEHYKPIIVSVTSDTDDAASLASIISQLQELRGKLNDRRENGKARIAVEFNTSCPNIKNSPPPGYDFESLRPLLQVLSEAHARDPTLTIGLKLPPFVHERQFHSIINQIISLTHQSTTVIGATGSISPSSATGSVISFLTCTNTLGNSLLFADQCVPVTSSPSPSSRDSSSLASFALPTALGGLAGEALHPLALGNVYQFSQILKGLEKGRPFALRIKIIGVGGVTSKEARERMTKAGADVVACATLFGKEGVKAFEILGRN